MSEIIHQDYLDIFDIHKGAEISKEIDELEEVINRFISGRMSSEKFLAFRSTHGIYGVRHYPEGMHMVRIKLPQGIINSDQLSAVAKMVEKYAGSGVAHITTRQDLQLHYIKLEKIPDLFRDMAKAGLTSKEACGNTVRNITSSPFTGISKDEIFDVLPYAMFMTRYFLRHPLTTTLPRKFKIAWSESEKDWGMVRIHDLGFIAQIKVKDDKKIRGFKVYVGGGLGAITMPAEVLTDFVEAEDVYYLSEAIIRVFHRHGERKLRSKARIKFLVAKMGIEKFREEVFKEFERIRKFKNISKELEEYLSKFPHPAPTNNGRSIGKVSKTVSPDNLKNIAHLENTPEYLNWVSNNVIEQKQEEFCTALIRINLGNLKPEDLRNIAQVSEKYGAGYVITTQRQDIIIPWIKKELLVGIYKELNDAKLITNESLPYITSCPGAYSCKLAITYPYNLAEAISKEVKNLMGVRINISGCPNSCGQHHIGDIGLSGNAIAVDDGVIPHYLLYLGGYPYEEHAVIGNALMKVPSKNVPKVVSYLINMYSNERRDHENFRDFLKRIGIDRIKKELSNFTKYPSKSEDIDFYKDWGQDKEFQIEAAKRGECAGSLLDIISISLFEAQREVYEAEEYIAEEEFGTVIQKSFKSVLKAIQSILYLDGEEITDDKEILKRYKSSVSSKRIINKKFENFDEEFSKWPTLIGTSDKKLAEEILSKASEFVRSIDKAFLRLTPELKIEQLNKDEEDKYSYGE